MRFTKTGEDDRPVPVDTGGSRRRRPQGAGANREKAANLTVCPVVSAS